MPTDREALTEFQTWATDLLNSKSTGYSVILRREVRQLCDRMGLCLLEGRPAEPPRLVRSEVLAAE